MKVAILYSEVKREYFPTKAQYLTEKDAFSDAQAIAGYLKKMGIEPLLYPGNIDMVQKLHQDKPEMVLNLVDSIRGSELLAATIPAILDLMEIPYTGVKHFGSVFAYNKYIIELLLKEEGIPVPNGHLFDEAKEVLNIDLLFPVISKLNEIHGAVEITKDAVSEDKEHLYKRVKFLIETYCQPILVDEFINGREFTAIFLEGAEKKVFLAEKVFNKPKAKYLFATFEDQWISKGYTAFHYGKYQDEKLEKIVTKAFAVTKMAGYGKFDIRLDSSNRYFLVDCNPNPAFAPTDCAITTILGLYGISFEEILKILITKSK